MTTATLRTDGGSRGNPGTAGIGFTLELEGSALYRGGSYIGETTNNVAEYTALVWGLENAKAAGVDDLIIEADSELMVKQVQGEYRVKNEGLKPLFAEVRGLLAGFESYSINHVYRENNAEADALANEAMDAKATVGDFLRKPRVKQSLFDLTPVAESSKHKVSVPAEEYSSSFAKDDSLRDSRVEEFVRSYEAEQNSEWDSTDTTQADNEELSASSPTDVSESVAATSHVYEPHIGAAAQADTPNLFSESVPAVNHDVLPETAPVIASHGASGVYELTVKEHFDAAHALVGYDGPCKNLHGHTWDVEVSVEGTRLDEVGILYDFKSLKEDLRLILDAYDHHYLNDVVDFADCNSTAENMARIIFDHLEGLLPSQVSVTEVCVWESPVARLRYRRK